jgi:hypothetical protein
VREGEREGEREGGRERGRGRERESTPHRLLFPARVTSGNNEQIIVFRADAKVHAHAPGRRRDIALAGDRSWSLTAISSPMDPSQSSV